MRQLLEHRLFPAAMAVSLLAIAALAWHFSPATVNSSTSPRVFCTVKDRTVATVFTLDELIATVRQEHRSAEVLDKGETIDVRTPLILMEFRKLPKQGVVLTDITILKSFEHLTPSTFLGM
jgi:hypothetical protein